MTVAAFDKTNLRQIRAEIDAALSAISTTHGIALSIGNIRFDAGQFRAKLEGTALGKVIGTQTLPSGDTGYVAPKVAGGLAAQLIAVHGEKAGLPGAKFKVPGHASAVEIVAYKPSRPKYPFVYRTERGALWKMTATSMRASKLLSA